jgi:hypothetical protein
MAVFEIRRLEIFWKINLEHTVENHDNNLDGTEFTYKKPTGKMTDYLT